MIIFRDGLLAWNMPTMLSIYVFPLAYAKVYLPLYEIRSISINRKQMLESYWNIIKNVTIEFNIKSLDGDSRH